MADQGVVSLDFSNATPIQQAPAQSGVALDFSQAQPLESENGSTPGFSDLHNVTAGDVGGALWNMGKDAATGFAKNAGQTVKSIVDLPDTIAGAVTGHPRQPDKIDQALKTNANEQVIGGTGENVAEFMLGSELMKAIPAIKRLELIGKAGKLAESHPILGKIIQAGVTALTQGSLGAAQGLAHGESAKTALEQGGSIGVLGGTAEGVSSLAPDAVVAAKNVANKFKPESIQPGLQQGIRDAVTKVVEQTASAASDTDNFHQALQERGSGNKFSDLKVGDQSKVLQRAQQLKAAGNGASTVTKAKPPASIRDVVEDAADQVYAKSKAQYGVLDQATGGQFQKFDNALQNVNKNLREIAGIDEDKEAALLSRKAELEAAQDQVFEDAKTKGVDPKLVDQAKANYKRSQALYDLDSNVKKSVSGMRPDIGDAKLAAKNPETVDPRKLFNSVNNLYDSGRLQEALGEKGADDLLSHVNERLVQHKVILRNQAIAKAAGKVALGSGVAYEAGKGVLGEMASR